MGMGTACLFVCFHKEDKRVLNVPSPLFFSFFFFCISAYKFPFVLAFASGEIEVRTLINGKLVQTLTLPSINFLTSKTDLYLSSTSEDRADSDIYKLVCGE